MTASPLEHVLGDRPKTFQNLIHLLSAKIDCPARCALYDGEARSEGFEDCAQVFSGLAVKEREGINSLLECLAEHVDQRQQAAG
jgi:hypothetical protein